MPRLPPILLCVLVTLGACEMVKETLGLEDEAQEVTPDKAKLDVGDDETDDGQDDTKRKKRKRRKAKPEPQPPPPPEAELDATLVRAIVPVEDGLWRVDPFVLALVADTLARGENEVPFTRISTKERKAGAPASFRVNALPTPSMWRMLGLQPDDLVLSLEDTQPPGPKGLAQLRERLPLEGTLTVKIQRNGLVKELRYRIEPGLAWTRYLEVEAGRTFENPSAREGTANTRSGGGSKSSGSSSSSSSSSSSKTPSSNPAEVPVKCSGSTCRVPKWYFDSLVGSSSKAKQQMRGSSIGSGFKVSFVGPASRKAGFSVGDVITKINGRRTNNQLDMLALYGGLQSTKKYSVEYTRGASKRSKIILVEG